MNPPFRSDEEKGAYMNITISGKNLEVSDGLRKAVTDKLGKLERRLDQAELRKIFLGIYAGPVDAKRSL